MELLCKHSSFISSHGQLPLSRDWQKRTRSAKLHHEHLTTVEWIREVISLAERHGVLTSNRCHLLHLSSCITGSHQLCVCFARLCFIASHRCNCKPFSKLLQQTLAWNTQASLIRRWLLYCHACISTSFTVDMFCDSIRASLNLMLTESSKVN